MLGLRGNAKPAYVPPTVESEVEEVLKSVRPEDYAPPGHPDRISSTSRIMCEAIEKVLADTASGIDERVVDLKALVKEVTDHVAIIEEGVASFKAGMKEAADGLKERVQEVMAHYEDITAKLQESPFNGSLPTFLKPEETTKEQ